MRKLLLATALLVATTAHAQDVTLNPIYPVCDSLESFKEMSRAFAAGDTRTQTHLLQTKRCLKLPRPIPATLLETGWTGWVKVRVWVGDDAISLWTNYESTKGGR